MSDAVPVPGAPAETTSLRLVMTLTVSGVLAGLLLSFAYHSTLPLIQTNRANREREAAAEVLGAPAKVEPYYLVGGKLVPDAPAGADATRLEKAFRGTDAAGTTTGWAIRGSSTGYADVVAVMLGYDPATRRLIGMKVVDCRETPGLGDGVQKRASFTGQFPGRETPLVPVKPGKGTGDPHEVDTISGATISSKTVVRAINAAVARWAPLIEAAGAAAGGPR